MATTATTTPATTRRTMRRRRAAWAAHRDWGGAFRAAGSGGRRLAGLALDRHRVRAMAPQGTHRADHILAMVRLDPGVGARPPHHVQRARAAPQHVVRNAID